MRHPTWALLVWAAALATVAGVREGARERGREGMLVEVLEENTLGSRLRRRDNSRASSSAAAAAAAAASSSSSAASSRRGRTWHGAMASSSRGGGQGGLLAPMTWRVPGAAVPSSRPVAPAVLAAAVDPCLVHEECSRCTEDSRCGWCGANGMCAAGGPRGAKTLQCPQTAWNFMFCTGESCRNYRACRNCIADPYCAWCPTEGGGQCGEGSLASGGLDGNSRCPVPWLRSLVRKGLGSQEASRMDAEHAQYLDQVCDGNGTLAYIPPPPPTPRPAPSLPVVTSIEPHHGPVFGRTVITITGLFFGLLPHEQEVTLGGKELCATMVWVSQSVIRCTTKPVESPVGKGFEHLLVEVTRKQGKGL